MNNFDTVSKFVSGNYSGSFSNSNHTLIVEGDTIYSYGKHFPIATLDRELKTYVFNHNKRSMTTTRHQHLVLSQLHQAGYTENKTKEYNNPGFLGIITFKDKSE